jgi:hypothetical protein
MFEAARSYIGGAKIIINSDGIQEIGVVRHPTLPVILCSASAIEIELKALLKLHAIPRPSGDGHDLKQLFDALRPDQQVEILKFQVSYTSCTADTARQALYAVKDVFKTWRYAYEKPTLETSPSFLLHFALALSDYIQSSAKIERSENGWLKTLS